MDKVSLGFGGIDEEEMALEGNEREIQAPEAKKWKKNESFLAENESAFLYLSERTARDDCTKTVRELRLEAGSASTVRRAFFVVQTARPCLSPLHLEPGIVQIFNSDVWPTQRARSLAISSPFYH